MERVLSLVSKINFKKIEELLKAGADVNIKIGINQDTLLHCSYSLEITKLLLLYGANVNTRNVGGETPLHCAVIEQKGLPVIQELLKNGAEINAVDEEGKTTLFHSVEYRRNSDERLNVWKELLTYGADIEMSCLEYQPYRHYCIPLCKAIGNEDQFCAMFFIKMTLIKNLWKGSRNLIDFNTYLRLSNSNPLFLDELSCYQDDCLCEIVRIKTHKFHSNYSLLDFLVLKKGERVKPLYCKTDNITDKEIIRAYPIYHDVILSSLILCLHRGRLLDELKKFEIGVRVDTSTLQPEKTIILLTSDCLFMIAEYLTNDELTNFIAACD